MKTQGNKWVIVSAILGISAIEVTALIQGVNGQLMSFMCIIIAGLAGYVIPSPLKSSNKK